MLLSEWDFNQHNSFLVLWYLGPSAFRHHFMVSQPVNFHFPLLKN